jgi:hypothetical protein
MKKHLAVGGAGAFAIGAVQSGKAGLQNLILSLQTGGVGALGLKGAVRLPQRLLQRRDHRFGLQLITSSRGYSFSANRLTTLQNAFMVNHGGVW